MPKLTATGNKLTNCSRVYLQLLSFSLTASTQNPVLQNYLGQFPPPPWWVKLFCTFLQVRFIYFLQSAFHFQTRDFFSSAVKFTLWCTVLILTNAGRPPPPQYLRERFPNSKTSPVDLFCNHRLLAPLAITALFSNPPVLPLSKYVIKMKSNNI